MGKIKREIRAVKRPARGAATGLEALAAGVLTAAAGWILYSTFGIDHEVDLPDALATERKLFYSERAGKLSYYSSRAGEGRPLVLLHSINAAASAYEMRPLFEHYQGTRPVYALDLPGYGFSERSQRVYDPELFAHAILDFLEQEVKEPADVIANSLTSEFAARAALSAPEKFRSLAMISPTGFNDTDPRYRSQSAQSMGASNMLHSIFAFPVWSRAFYDLIATQASIRYFLEKSFVGAIPDALVEYDFATSHQPGAENVPLYFISGKLFTKDVRSRIYENVHTPTLVLYDHDAFTNFDRLPDLLERNRDWRSERIIPTMGLPHWDQPGKTTAALDAFWAGV
jgi:pimeloyl-ACP methyl ester carboxylesterase